ILVVDDEIKVLEMIRFFLEKSGYLASTANCAESAYQLLDQNNFDAILTDVNMPGEDGIKFLAKIHKQLPDVPVIMMTGYAQLQTAVDAIKNGAFEFICKPFDLQHLTQVLDKALEFSRLRHLEKRYRAELEETVALRTDELKNALTQLDKTRKLLLDTSTQKNEFMTTITHEMRTPMNGVIGALDLMLETDLAGAPREYLLLARQSADNMMALVNQLLSFSDRVNNVIVESNEIINLWSFLEELVHDYLDRCAAKGLELDIRIDSDVPHRVGCDGEHLSQLLHILLGNAIKFTDNGEISLNVSVEQHDDKSALIHFSVKDSGIGIPEEMLEHIFDPFFQVDGSITRRYGGIGLGLSIAQQIAQLLGGRIWAASTLGDGSIFHFCTKVTLAR
ncbi:MAG: response regulator, partial [Deltaproteobacteria bacterium]